MSGRRAIALRALIAAAVPALLIGNVLWLLAGPWFVRAQYVLPGIPQRVEGLSSGAARDLGTRGVWAVHPAGEGVRVLERARLDDGTPAFTSAEVSHMDDVRGVVTGFGAAWAIALAVAVAAALALRRGGAAGAALHSVRAGARLTLAAALLLAVAMAVSFQAFFTAFHEVFFAGDSWRFAADSTLLALYPEPFWVISGAAAAGLVVLQALAVEAVARRRRLGRPSRSF